MYPSGEINVSEKSVAKSCVAKLSVAKSTYTVQVVGHKLLWSQDACIPNFHAKIKNGKFMSVVTLIVLHGMVMHSYFDVLRH